jgi:hypothetical protein
MHFKIPKNVTFPPSTKNQIGKSGKLISLFKERKKDAVTRERKIPHSNFPTGNYLDPREKKTFH